MKAPKPQTLNDRQERFVHEYLIDQNATAAAGRAGYSAKTKGTHAAQLMKNPLVKLRINEELGALFARLNLKAFEVLRGQVRAAYLDPAKLFDAAQEPIPLDQLDEDTRGGLTVTYAKRRGGDYTMRVKQTPRHVALNILQKRLDAFEKLQAEVFAEIEEEEAQEPALPAKAAPSIFTVPLQLDAHQPTPMDLAAADAALAQAAQGLPAAEAKGAVTAPSNPSVPPVAPAQMAQATVAPTPVPAVAEADDAPPPSPFEPGYDFKKDPNAMYGGRFTAWNRYWRERKERELARAEEAAALLNPPANFRVGPGKTVPVRIPQGDFLRGVEPGYNPPWLRNNRQEFAIGAGECWID